MQIRPNMCSDQKHTGAEMPNHITNVLTITAENADQIKAEIAGSERLIDFNAVIKMPESLMIEASTFVEAAAWIAGGDEPKYNQKTKDEWLSLFAEQREILLEQGRKHNANISRYGYANWYGWAPDYWGTKWNAYDTAMRGDSIKFETAWCFPEPVMIALSAKYPAAEFRLDYADEDTGSNCGTVVFRAGAKEIIDVAPPWSEQSDADHRKWRKFAFLLQYPGESPLDHDMDENYEYIEE